MNELSEQNLICPHVGKDEKIPRLLITDSSKLFYIYPRFTFDEQTNKLCK